MNLAPFFLSNNLREVVDKHRASFLNKTLQHATGNLTYERNMFSLRDDLHRATS